MSLLQEFYTELQGGELSVSVNQASDFAKNIADDFNPIHDANSRRFCVPGDLLFAIALDKYGISESMDFYFRELVGSDSRLSYPTALEGGTATQVTNQNGKAVLSLNFDGISAHDEERNEQLIRNYVAFSGQNFPGILVPLMREHNVMINPKRPLVIYQSMSLRIDDLGFSNLNITLSATSLSVSGKRGDAELHFELKDGAKCIGTGVKKLVLSGLREYEAEAIDSMCQQYYSAKEKWTN